MCRVQPTLAKVYRLGQDKQARIKQTAKGVYVSAFFAFFLIIGFLLQLLASALLVAAVFWALTFLVHHLIHRNTDKQSRSGSIANIVALATFSLAIGWQTVWPFITQYLSRPTPVESLVGT